MRTSGPRCLSSPRARRCSRTEERPMRVFGAVVGAVGVALITLGRPEGTPVVVSTTHLDARSPASATLPAVKAEAPALSLSATDASRVIQQVCVVCHNDVTRVQDLTLQGFDVSKA